jgi:hypothetical protein
MSNRYKKLYNQIYNAIPKKMFANELGIEACAVSIYLTTQDVRPACAPFDGDIYGGMYGNEMFKKMTETKIGKNALDKLGKINKLKIVIGPYSDVGNFILVVNKDRYNELKPILKRISNIPKPTDEKMILIGKMLGYVCPMSLRKIHKMVESGIPIYNIRFMVNETRQMGVFCPIDMKYIKKSTKLLNEMKIVLEKIDKNVELIISLKNKLF